MNRKKILQTITVLAVFVISAGAVYAENIDPNNSGNQYSWGENVGWLNFKPNPNTSDGVQVASDKLTGWVWAENIGWISLSCDNTNSCGTVSYGVVNDGSGNLSGYAWSENVGWISFSCGNTGSCGSVSYGVTIDSHGNLSGNAWAENIGWINFSLATDYVVACKVTFEDLANFVALWLQSGANSAADLDGSNAGYVDFEDYAIFSSYWQDFCPDGWLLK